MQAENIDRNQGRSSVLIAYFCWIGPDVDSIPNGTDNYYEFEITAFIAH
jgi:hypothetical protein